MLKCLVLFDDHNFKVLLEEIDLKLLNILSKTETVTGFELIHKVEILHPNRFTFRPFINIEFGRNKIQLIVQSDFDAVNFSSTLIDHNNFLKYSFIKDTIYTDISKLDYTYAITYSNDNKTKKEKKYA